MFSSPISPRIPRAVAPAFITLTSMFCGYLSITFVLKGAYTTAAWMIVVSGVLDAFDGPVARLLQATSKFGGELDSFADLVSFGLAPSLLFYRVYFMGWGVPGVIIAFLPAMISALRLTRYNITSIVGKREYFSGFTTTASASLLASFLIFSNDVWHGRVLSGVAAVLVVLTSALMISKVRYITVSKFADGLYRTPKGILCVVVGASVILFPAKAFFPAMLALMLEGLVSRPIGHAVHHLEGIRRQHHSA